VGVELINSNGNRVKIFGTRSFNSLSPSGYRTSTLNCFIPGIINPGEYQLRIVTRPTDGDWKIVTASHIGNGIPTSIDFMVQ
jgi:hypothetical protein